VSPTLRPLTLTAALAEVEQQEATLATLLQALYDSRFTGSLLLYCRNGVPRVAEFPSTRVQLAPLPKLGGS
jgi:hypothetical protein